MKILKNNVRFYANQEVKQILENESDKFLDQVKYFCSFKPAKVNLYENLKKYNLVEFEILQLINLCPTQIIDLSLVIEEIEERYSEEKLNEILDLFK